MKASDLKIGDVFRHSGMSSYWRVVKVNEGDTPLDVVNVKYGHERWTDKGCTDIELLPLYNSPLYKAMSEMEEEND